MAARIDALIDNDDLEGLYQVEAGTVPLLTPAEEKRLFTERDQLRLKLKNANGDGPAISRQIRKIEDRIILANTRLVMGMAARVKGRLRHIQGLDLEDVRQEGNLGLMKAVDLFEVGRGNKFSTYAVWWIRQAISRAFPLYATTIRIPVHWYTMMGKVNQCYSERLTAGLPTDPAAMAEEMNLAAELIEQAIKDIALLQPNSLETPILDGERADPDLSLADFVPGDGQAEIDDYVMDGERKEQLEALLNTLKPREAQILKFRFGLADGRCLTLEEVAQKFDLTRERIRQIEALALRRLRHPRRLRRLRDLL